jgi:hypothetical protein
MQPTCTTLVTTLVLVLFLPLLHCSSAVPTLPTAPTDLGFLLGSADVAIRSSLIPGAGLGAFAIRRLEVREGEIENVCGVVWCGVVWCAVLCCDVLCCCDSLAASLPPVTASYSMNQRASFPRSPASPLRPGSTTSTDACSTSPAPSPTRRRRGPGWSIAPIPAMRLPS